MRRRKWIKKASLAGFGISLSPAILTAINSCSKAPESTNNQFNMFSNKQGKILENLVDLIIPNTSTPGAAAAGVHYYIDLVFFHVTDKEESGSFLSELEVLVNSGFIDLSLEEKTDLLNKWEDSDDEKGDFFNTLKGLTIHGYYTSKIGASQELEYVHAAGIYDGEKDYSEVGKNYY